MNSGISLFFSDDSKCICCTIYRMECTSRDANCVLSVPPGVLTVCYPHPLGVLIKPTFRECMQFPKDQYHIFARSVIIFLLLSSKVYCCEYRCKSLRSQSLCCAPLMTITFSRGSKMDPNGQIRLSRFTITRSKCALRSQEHCSAVDLFILKMQKGTLIYRASIHRQPGDMMTNIKQYQHQRLVLQSEIQCIS